MPPDSSATKMGGWWSKFADLPKTVTDAANLPEAMSEAEDCLGSALAFRLAHKEEFPFPSAPQRGQRVVRAVRIQHSPDDRFPASQLPRELTVADFALAHRPVECDLRSHTRWYTRRGRKEFRRPWPYLAS